MLCILFNVLSFPITAITVYRSAPLAFPVITALKGIITAAGPSPSSSCNSCKRVFASSSVISSPNLFNFSINNSIDFLPISVSSEERSFSTDFLSFFIHSFFNNREFKLIFKIYRSNFRNLF